MNLYKKWIVLLILPICSSQAGYTTVSEICDTQIIAEMHELCGAYSFLQMKPLLINLEDLKSTIEVYKVESNAKNQQILALQHDIKLKEEETTKKLNELETSNHNLSKTISAKNNHIGELENDIKEKLAHVNQLLSNCKITVETFQIESKSKDSVIQSKEKDLQQANSNIQFHQSTIEQLTEQKSNLERNMASKETDLRTLKDQFNSINREYQTAVHKYPESCVSNEMSSFQNIFLINPTKVLCDNGWIVIQQRIDGTERFQRKFCDYKFGFGEVSSEFFIGLENLYKLTSKRTHELYIHLEDSEGNVRYAHYDNFKIDNSSENYRLISLGSYSGNAGDSMSSNEGYRFSTIDDDTNDYCAYRRKGGWWYTCESNCGDSNLNGRFNQSPRKSIYWYSWGRYNINFNFVQMKIKPKA